LDDRLRRGAAGGSQAARWFAVVVIGLNAIGQMVFIPAYPFCRC
jgi:hypothetical protein